MIAAAFDCDSLPGMKRTAKARLPLPPVASHLYARPKLAIGLATVVTLFFLLPGDWEVSTRALAAWDGGTLAYLILAFATMGNATTEGIR